MSLLHSVRLALHPSILPAKLSLWREGILNHAHHWALLSSMALSMQVQPLPWLSFSCMMAGILSWSSRVAAVLNAGWEAEIEVCT